MLSIEFIQNWAAEKIPKTLSHYRKKAIQIKMNPKKRQIHSKDLSNLYMNFLDFTKAFKRLATSPKLNRMINENAMTLSQHRNIKKTYNSLIANRVFCENQKDEKSLKR